MYFEARRRICKVKNKENKKHTHSSAKEVIFQTILTEELAVKHVVDTAWGSHYNMRCLCLQLLDLVAHVGAPDTGVACRTHVVSKSQDHLLDLY